MLKSFTHGSRMADLVIDDRSDRGDISNGGGGGSMVALAGSNTWHLG